MQLNISGHHVDVTDAMKSYVEEKLQKLERHYDHITNAHVILTVEKIQQRAEATVHISGAEVFADANCDDMYAAIDGLSDKLDKQVRRHKDRIRGHHASAAKRAAAG